MQIPIYFNPFFWYHYYFYETLFVITIIIFSIQYLKGLKHNKRLANIHMKRISIELEKHFKNVGNNGVLFEEDNPHTFKLYASNNPIMKFCLVALYV